MYQLLDLEDVVLRLSDNICVQIDDGNVDYQEYLRWVSQGNQPLPYVPPVAPPETNWPGFVVAIQNDGDFRAVWCAANATDPLAAQSLLVAFGYVATGGLETFDPLYNAVCALGEATTEQRDAWATLAEDYHVPAKLVSAIRGT